MSKLMTAELLLQHVKDGRLKLEDTLHVSEYAWREQFRHPRRFTDMAGGGFAVTVDTLLKGVIVQSGGDACSWWPRHWAVTKPAFPPCPTSTPWNSGLTNSHFVDTTGMPDPERVIRAPTSPK